MRRLPLLPLALLAACSGAPDETVAAPEEAAPIAAARPGPRPAASPAPAGAEVPRGRVSMRCIDGSRFVAHFDADGESVTIVAGGSRRVLRRDLAAPGLRYAAGGDALERQGANYLLAMPGQPPLPCTVNRR